MRPPLGDVVHRFSNFVPEWVAAAAAREARLPERAIAERMTGAILLCDVSGFTALGERLALLGPEGAELLWGTVNGYFGEMLAILRAHGGDVLRFAGDAPIVLWRDPAEGPADAALRAAACGLELHAKLAKWVGPEGAVLTIRSALASGPLLAARVGGVGGRWEPIVGGAPFHELSAALAEAGQGEFLVTTKALEALGASATARRTPGGNARLERVQAPPPRALREPALDDSAKAAMQAYLPDLVVGRIVAGHGAWLGELRTVSVVFVGVEEIAWDAPDAPELLDRIARVAQLEAVRYDGSLNQFLVDDKGTVLLAAWGLPTCTHEDDAARAVKWAMAVEQALSAIGLSVKTGVSSGRVFCGAKGDGIRAEYGLLGAEVNLAARLMQRSDGHVLCSASTRRAAEGRVAFVSGGEILVKGRGTAVQTWMPAEGAAPTATAARAVFGRADELHKLLGLVRGLDQGGGVALVRGEAGIGKSTLLAEFVTRVGGEGVPVYTGEADAIERRTPYHAFRGVFHDLLRLGAGPREERLEKARAWLGSNPEWLRLLPLFEAVLGLEVPETEETAALGPEGRSNLTVQSYTQVLATAGRCVIVLDDVHWMDSASWELLKRVRTQLPNALFVLGSRPLDPSDHALQVLSGMAGSVAIDLGPLGLSELRRLVAGRLGVEVVSEDVMAVIARRSEGHPFFAEEIALVLRDRGLLSFDGGRCSASPAAGNLGALELPSTLEALIAGRLDVLGPTEQLSLKTAAVIGRSFSHHMVRDIFPIEAERRRVPEALERARTLDLVREEAPEPDAMGVFNHAVTQEVAYGQLLFQQRRELHAAAARWVEERTELASRPWPLLAHHWRRAEVRERAIDALEAAGTQAFRSYASREAIDFIEAAIVLDDGGNRSPNARRARWERMLGEARARVGQLGEADAHFKRALELIGHPVPSNKVALVVAFAVECLRQVWRRYRGAPTPKEEGRDVLIDAGNAYAELGLNAYFAGDLLFLLYGTILGLNLVESAGPSPDLARMKAGMAVVVGSIPMHGAARSYSLEALAIAEHFDDDNAHANAQHYRGALLCGDAEWDEAFVLLSAAAEGYARCGNIRRYDEAVQCVAHAQMNRGNYREALLALDELLRSARGRGDPQGIFWAAAVRVEWLWRQGRVREAAAVAASVDVQASKDEIFIVRLSGLRVHLALAEKDIVGARAAAAKLTLARPASFVQLWNYTANADLELAAWESGATDRKKAARAACKLLDTFAGIFAIGRPYAGLAHGRLQRLEGRLDRAAAAFEKAAVHAKAANMPLEELLALDRRIAIGDAGAEGFKERAEALRTRWIDAAKPTSEARVGG